jgi:hypothetical protein
LFVSLYGRQLAQIRIHEVLGGCRANLAVLPVATKQIPAAEFER